MGDVLDEAYGIMQCKECPWYKSCVMPMRLTAEDLRRQMAQTPGVDLSQQSGASMESFISGMANAAQNSLLEGCPVFIERLRSNPKLAQQIKQIMQNWSQAAEG